MILISSNIFVPSVPVLRENFYYTPFFYLRPNLMNLILVVEPPSTGSNCALAQITKHRLNFQVEPWPCLNRGSNSLNSVQKATADSFYCSLNFNFVKKNTFAENLPNFLQYLCKKRRNLTIELTFKLDFDQRRFGTLVDLNFPSKEGNLMSRLEWV